MGFKESPYVLTSNLLCYDARSFHVLFNSLRERERTIANLLLGSEELRIAYIRLHLEIVDYSWHSHNFSMRLPFIFCSQFSVQANLCLSM